MPSLSSISHGTEDPTMLAQAFIAGFRSPDTRSAYRRDLNCWLSFCLDQDVHPYAGVRRTHVETYLRDLEQERPPLANNTLRRRISTLSSWFTWLEDEDRRRRQPRGARASASPACPAATVAGSQRAHRRAHRRRGGGRRQLRAGVPAGLERPAHLRGVRRRCRRSRRLPLSPDAADRRQGRQAGGDPAQPANAPGDR